MMRVVLVRHGDALPPQVDLARPLSSLGSTQVQSVGEQINALDFHPAEIYHSPMLRAAQSAHIIADTIDDAPEPVESEELLPNSPLDRVISDLMAGEDDLVLVGHMPLLQDLADELLAKKGQLAPALGTGCALVLNKHEDESWVLEQLLTPK